MLPVKGACPRHWAHAAVSRGCKINDRQTVVTVVGSFRRRKGRFLEENRSEISRGSLREALGREGLAEGDLLSVKRGRKEEGTIRPEGPEGLKAVARAVEFLLAHRRITLLWRSPSKDAERERERGLEGNLPAEEESGCP